MIAKLTDWAQVGEKPSGGNPGAVYDAPCGTRYFVKGNRRRTPADALTSDIHAQCEVLAGKLLALAGVQTANTMLIDLGKAHRGGLGIASEAIAGRPLNLAYADERSLLQRDFAAYAWTGVGDVCGPDNIFLRDGQCVNVDVGSAILFGQTGTFLYEDGQMPTIVREWTGMRKKLGMAMFMTGFRSPAAKVEMVQSLIFANTSPEMLRESASRVLAITESDVVEAVREHGPGDDGMRRRVAESLLARREWIVTAAIM